ncbi:hypothetical protein AND_000031 [Anopheles darlingi]|uniref:Uncharacterized protein n=1 Tax=Anopheles darlingi TaxID=43151 RepID=W5JXD1_ANODA|nr:hypothetical protein AND_000031 [Anopheles darlingi]
MKQHGAPTSGKRIATAALAIIKYAAPAWAEAALTNSANCRLMARRKAWQRAGLRARSARCRWRWQVCWLGWCLSTCLCKKSSGAIGGQKRHKQNGSGGQSLRQVDVQHPPRSGTVLSGHGFFWEYLPVKGLAMSSDCPHCLVERRLREAEIADHVLFDCPRPRFMDSYSGTVAISRSLPLI